MPQSTAYIDLLGTVMEVDGAPPSGKPIPAGWKLVRFLDGVLDPVIIRVRPSALPFLKGLKQRGYKVCILSGSDSDSLIAFLTAGELIDHVDEVYGDDSGPLRPPGPYVIVDDTSPEKKLGKFGFYQNRMPATDWLRVLAMYVVLCHQFFRSADTHPLTDLPDEIEAKLAGQAV